MTTFKEWWFEYGSAMRQGKNEDSEEFAHRIAEGAWENSRKINWNLAIDKAAKETTIDYDRIGNELIGCSFHRESILKLRI